MSRAFEDIAAELAAMTYPPSMICPDEGVFLEDGTTAAWGIEVQLPDLQDELLFRNGISADNAKTRLDSHLANFQRWFEKPKTGNGAQEKDKETWKILQGLHAVWEEKSLAGRRRKEENELKARGK